MGSKQEAAALLAAVAAGPQENSIATSAHSIPKLVVTPFDSRLHLTFPHHQSSASRKKTSMIQMVTRAIIQQNRSALDRLFKEKSAAVIRLQPTYDTTSPDRIAKLSKSTPQRISTSDSSFTFTQAQKNDIRLIFQEPSAYTSCLSEKVKKALPTQEGQIKHIVEKILFPLPRRSQRVNQPKKVPWKN